MDVSKLSGLLKDLDAKIQETVESLVGKDRQTGGAEIIITRPSLSTRIASVVSFLFNLGLFLLGVALFVYASLLAYRCVGIPMWGRILVFISYFIFPIIAPLGFILFNLISPMCKGPVLMIPKITI